MRGRHKYKPGVAFNPANRLILLLHCSMPFLLVSQASLSGEPDEESDELLFEEESSVDASPLRQDSSRRRSHGRTSTGSFRLERQPLANDAEGEGDFVPPPPPRRVSLWGSIRTCKHTCLFSVVRRAGFAFVTVFGLKCKLVEHVSGLLLI